MSAPLFWHCRKVSLWRMAHFVKHCYQRLRAALPPTLVVEKAGCYNVAQLAVGKNSNG
jgi:hypothetical protein